MWPFSLVFIMSCASGQALALARGTEIITVPPSRPSRRAAAPSSVNEISVLWSDAVSLISNIYPSSSITNVAALSWPSAVVIHGSTEAVAPTSTSVSASRSTSSTSTSESTVALASSTFLTSTTSATSTTQLSQASASSKPSPESTTPSSSTGGTGRTTVVVLSVVCTILGLAAIAGVLWFCYRTWKRQKALSDESDDEYWHTSSSGSQMAEDKTSRYDDRSIPALPPDPHRYSLGHLPKDMSSSSPDNPFIAAEERHNEHTQTLTDYRGTDRENWWERGPQRASAPANGPWAPPPRSPKRPVSQPVVPAPALSRQFDFGFNNSQTQRHSFTVPRRPVPNLSTPNGQILPPSPSPIFDQPTPKMSSLHSEVSTPRSSSYRNNRCASIAEADAE